MKARHHCASADEESHDSRRYISSVVVLAWFEERRLVQSQPVAAASSCPMIGSIPGGSFCAEPLRLTPIMVLALMTLSSVVDGVRSTAELATAATPPGRFL